MKTHLPFMLIFCLLLTALPALAQPPSEVSVRDFGAAGDGVTDDTYAFTKAMAAVKEKGGTVKVPVGNYMIRTHISVPSNVTLEGVWRIPTAWTANLGSTLLAVEGAGSEDGPAFITLGTNSTIKGLTIFYPDQRPDAIKPYPWCVACAGGDNSSIVDCLLVNPYQAVDFGSKPSGRHYIRNLYGQPLRRGIFVDKCLDIGRIENVHFWPFWTWDEKTGIQKWLKENGEAFIFGRTDWEYVLNTFCFGYKTGYRFIKTEQGSMNGNLLGIGADFTNQAVVVEQCQKPGLLITNGEFVSMGGERPTKVVVEKNCDGVVQFQNCSFWGADYQIARLEGKATVTFQNCNFLTWGYLSPDWQKHDATIPAIDQSAGKLIVNACTFAQGWPQLRVRGDAEAVIFTSNLLGGPLQVTNTSRAVAQIGLNAEQAPPPAPKRPAEEKGAIVVDDSDGSPDVMFSREWREVPEGGHYYKGTHWAEKGQGTAVAVFRPMVPKTGRYAVYVFVGPDPMNDHASNAPVVIKASDGEHKAMLNLRERQGTWHRLGTYRFEGGRRAAITFTNNADGNVLADAVKLVPVR